MDFIVDEWQQPPKRVAVVLELLLLEGLFVRNGEFLSAFAPAAGQYPTAVSSGHPFAETVFVLSFSLRGLIRAFHSILGFSLKGLQRCTGFWKSQYEIGICWSGVLGLGNVGIDQ